MFTFTHKSKFTNSRTLFHAFTRKKNPCNVFTTENRAVHAFTQTTEGAPFTTLDSCKSVLISGPFCSFKRKSNLAGSEVTVKMFAPLTDIKYRVV